MAQVTRLGKYGGPRPLYASFAGKSAAPVGGNTKMLLMGVGT